jgi:hypothetical protein
VASCPQVIELLIERGMDGDPNRRPSMQLIFNIMKQLDAIVNTTPIKPVKETADSYESSKNTNETNTIVNKIDTGWVGVCLFFVFFFSNPERLENY